MKEIFFNDRQGQTVLSTQERQGLKLFHVTQMSELDEFEQVNINKGLIWLSSYKGDILNEKFLRQLHKKLFGDVWKWAGTYRSSEKNIGIEYWKIPGEILKFHQDVAYWVAHKSYDWNELVARLHHRLVLIHPFPNGNGRLSRIYTNQFCKVNNQPIPTWHANLPAKQRRQQYIQALQAADLKKMQSLIKFFS